MLEVATDYSRGGCTDEGGCISWGGGWGWGLEKRKHNRYGNIRMEPRPEIIPEH